jgi:hypothetical protein
MILGAPFDIFDSVVSVMFAEKAAALVGWHLFTPCEFQIHNGAILRNLLAGKHHQVRNSIEAHHQLGFYSLAIYQGLGYVLAALQDPGYGPICDRCADGEVRRDVGHCHDFRDFEVEVFGQLNHPRLGKRMLVLLSCATGVRRDFSLHILHALGIRLRTPKQDISPFFRFPNRILVLAFTHRPLCDCSHISSVHFPLTSTPIQSEHSSFAGVGAF